MIPNCEHSELLDKLVPALIKAIGKMEAAHKDSTNPAFKSKYADLSSIMEAAKPALEENGIAVLQPPTADGEGICVATILLHNSGQWIASKLTLMPKDSSPQATGSAITYGRRYGLAGILGMTAEDDDGNAASDLKPVPPHKQAKPDDPEDLKKLLAQLEADPSAISDIGTHFKDLITEEMGAEWWAKAKKQSVACSPPAETVIRRLFWMWKTRNLDK